MPAGTYTDPHEYRAWVRAHDTLGEPDRLAIRDAVRRLAQPPLFSVVLLPAPDGTLTAAPACIASVRRQLYPHWELWLPQGTDPGDAGGDRRLRIVPGDRTGPADHVRLFNAALAAAAGEFVVPLPADARLGEAALYELAAAIGDNAGAALLYTDEDRLDDAGERCLPHFKTGWDPDLALGRDAIGLLVAASKARLDQLGGLREPAGGVAMALYELLLRLAFATPPAHIHHVPAILCHRCASPDASPGWDAQAAREIVRQHLAGCGEPASVVAAPLAAGWNRIVRDLPDPPPLVSIIVPTRDQAGLLARCADGLLARTDYPALELLIVDNDSREPAAIELLRRLQQDPRVRVLPYPCPFNYAALNNHAARQARGEILVLLNDDTDPIRPDWLREMVSHALRPDVGAVGAKLFYPDGRVQHAGVVLGPGLWPAHQLRFADRLDPGPAGELALTRTVSTVTGACLALRRSVFLEVGGLDEKLRVTFNDTDLCMRLGDHGYRIIWTPFAELFHLESASRGPGDTPEKQAAATQEVTYFWRSWKSLRDCDPFHNPNLVYGWDDVTLSWPPRRQRPWLA
jgi:GT2 family glycosyltransferase